MVTQYGDIKKRIEQQIELEAETVSYTHLTLPTKA